MKPTTESERRFHREVSRKEDRKLRARRGDMRGIWYGFGMFGMVGWSVAVPTLIGLAVGMWLDRTIERPYSFTLMGLLLGMAGGCYLAWYWVSRESRAANQEQDTEEPPGDERAADDSAADRTGARGDRR